MNEIFIFLISFTIIFCCCFCIKNSSNDQNSINNVKNIIKKRIKLMNEVVQTYKKDDESVVICPITQDVIEKGQTVKELPCGHQFSELIDEWIYKENGCPICREQVIEIV